MSSHNKISIDQYNSQTISMEEIEDALDNSHFDSFIDQLSKYREQGRDINQTDAAGFTWLTRAIVSQYYEPYDGCIENRMKAVLFAGGNPNKYDDEASPLLYACGWQFGYGPGPSSNLVKILLESGANPSPILDINIPSTYINEDGDIDFSDNDTTQITTIDEWLADIDYHNDLIEKQYNSYNCDCTVTRRELIAIRKLLAEYRDDSM